jgi:AmmeMemoRadiSam system protein B/AmmeMemoRadiSam system protein A
MKHYIKPLLLFGVSAVLILTFSFQAAQAKTVREPIRAGSFYPADPDKLRHLIERLTAKARKTQVQIPPDTHLRAVIMPHAGYIYSGLTAAHVSLVIKKSQFSKVILLGPDHFIGFTNGAICDVTAYKTPLGKIKLHDDIEELRRHPDLFHSLPVSRDREHSLEVVLPFLQTYLDKFQLVPIIVGHTILDRFSTILEGIIDDDTLLVVSSDLSHYLSYSEAVERDRETISRIMNLSLDRMTNTKNRACGVMPLRVLMQIAQRRNWRPVLLHYSNSGDTAGDRSRVVGYSAIALFGDLPMKNTNKSGVHFSDEQGQILVRLARNTIREKLGLSVANSDTPAHSLGDSAFTAQCGTFVTLKIDGQLRGCIGNLTSSESVLEGVKQNAINAAFHDPRFSPLSSDELDQTVIEVSILTAPQPLEYQDSQDLIKKLRVNVDGVIIRKSHTSATFLPQVWEQLPRPEDFLDHLCLKAGLSSDAWKKSRLEVLTYQVQYFEEKE